MKIPEKWLRHYCNPQLGSDELEHLLTMGGMEVESRETAAAPFSGVVVARILTATRHPDADRLQVCEVDTGADKPAQIVCGAPNARAGLVTACALPGAVLPGDFRIKPTKMRGVESNGMLCSGKELGMGDDHAGILELPEDLKPGTDLRQALDLDENILELKLTPNLAHCMSVTGVAQDLAALSNTAYTAPTFTPVPVSIDDRVPVSIEATDLCGRFAGRVIRGVNARAATPDWMKQRLQRAGQRPISALVDISNYVLLELGRPTHVFDLAKIRGGRLVVRWGREGEQLKLLNEQTVSVAPDAQGMPVGVVADPEGPLSLAGIMGGDESAVDVDTTTDVYLEAAFWWPAAIMGRPRRYNFTTDAAQRFERGVDAESLVEHLGYLSQLVLEICGGQAGPIDDVITALPERKPVSLRLARLRKVSGLDLQAADCEDAFRRLGMPWQTTGESDALVFSVTPPARRFDITIEEDLIEEVIRLYGYERIPTRPPKTGAAMRPAPGDRLDACQLKRRWVARDYQEVVNFSFVAENDDRRFRGADNACPSDGAGAAQAGIVASPGAGAGVKDAGAVEALNGAARGRSEGARAPAAIAVQNPIAAHMNVMRTSLWSGLLENLRYNLNRRAERVRLFEVGRVYLPVPGQAAGPLSLAGIAQPLRLGVLLFGTQVEPQWGESARVADFFDLKGDLQAAHPELALRFEAARHPGLHPGQSARILLDDGTPVGWIGALHPVLADTLDIPGPVLLAELDWAVLCRTTVVSSQRISRFPPAVRDLAVVVDEAVPAGALLQEIRALTAAEPALAPVKHVGLFDQYRGKGLENKEKSLAFRLWMQHTDRTLSDEEVDAVVAQILARLTEGFGARLRA